MLIVKNSHTLNIRAPLQRWNNDLESFAQHTAAQCSFDHTSGDARSQNIAGFSYIGENIYTIAGNVPQSTIKDAVNYWASEQKDYDIYSNTCSTSCGHY